MRIKPNVPLSPHVHLPARVALVVFILTSGCLATRPMPPDNLNSVIRLHRLARKTEAVHVDTDLYTRWLWHEEEQREAALREAVENLDAISTDIMGIPSGSRRFNKAKALLLDCCQLQQAIYRDTLEEHEITKHAKKMFGQLVDTHRAFSSVAVRLLPPGRDSEPDVQPMAAEGLDEEERIRLLEDVLDAGKYRPDLFRAWLRWRTEYQLYNHGASNMSFIPNDQYNTKRDACIETVRQHLQSHPDDDQAWHQLALLLIHPNIARGGPMGHTGLTEWGLMQGEQ